MIKIHVHPQKNANSYTKSYVKLCFSVHQIKILRSHIMSLSLKSFHVPKENIGYANKKEKNIHAKKHERKNAYQRAWEKIIWKKEKKKEKIKMAHIFKTNAKRERVMYKGV